jgi:tetratricopeptide (TPR) repeat protein
MKSKVTVNPKVTFYLIAGLFLGVSIYVGIQLFLSDEGPSTKKAGISTSEVNRSTKPSGSRRFSDSLSTDESVWNDPRLKDVKAGDIKEVKEKAEIENNLKVLTALYDQGSDEEFLSRLKGLIAERPEVKEYAALLGDYHYNEGNWVEAEAAVRRLIELDPQNMFARTSLAEVVAVQGRYDDGLQINQLVLESDARNIDAMYGVASISDMKGTPEQGMKIIESTYRKDATNGNAAAVYADLLFMKGKLEDSREIIKEGLKNDGQNPFLNKTAATIAAKMGQFSEAAKYSAIAAANETNAERKVDALNIGWQARIELKDFDGAEGDIRKILEIQPDNEFAIQALKTVNSLREKKGT